MVSWDGGAINLQRPCSVRISEVVMNMNPWHVEQLVEFNRARIRDEMKQIRKEEAAARSEQLSRARPQPGRPRQLVIVRLALAVLRGMTS